jgi:hypothetical protein
MGSTRYDASDWQIYSSATASKPAAAIFTQTSISNTLDPKKFAFRESVDSPANPNSTPIIVAVDETGSMGHLAEIIIKKGLGIIMSSIYDRKPVDDPHLCVAGVGDCNSDRSPFQMSQFESEVGPITQQIEQIYIEGNGGGNGGESYPGIWYFAHNKTKCDAITKRNRKGYLFTVGDESPHMTLSKEHIKEFFGDDIEKDIDVRDLLNSVRKNWEVFHIIVSTGSTISQNAVKVWKDLLGERAITIADTDKLAEVIVSTIQVIEGADPSKVADSWDGTTSVVVRDSIKNLDKS